MKKNIKLTLAAGCLLITGAASGCQNAANTNTANTNTAANTNAAVNQNANKPAANATPAETPAANTGSSTASLATPTDAYKTAYDMRKRKDIAGLKKVMSKDALEFFSMIGKPEKTLDDMLMELAESPQGSTDETRNEKIKGDTATLEYKNGKDEWKEMDFAKEGGEWKLTIPKGDGPGGPPKKP